jgi:hypothetical protein
METPAIARVFTELLHYLQGSAEDVFLRTYECSGGLPEAGMPPVRTHTDTPIIPRPLVLDADGAQTEGLKETFGGRRALDGCRKLITAGDCAAESGSILYFGGAEWEVTSMRAPVIYGEAALKLLLVRRVQA